MTALDTRGATLAIEGSHRTVGEITRLDADAGYLTALTDQSAQIIDVRNPAVPSHARLLSAGYDCSDVAAQAGVAGLAISGQSDMVYDPPRTRGHVSCAV